ncbi:MAG: TolC family protein [Verrucomicrobia bacterium]|nr:TolC family protein [Verrucomicrobiota bacterium]
MKTFSPVQRWPSLVMLMAALISARVSAQEAGLVDITFLDTLRLEVRTNHPTVAAAQARVRAAEAGIRAVRLWEDPMAGLGVMTAERSMRRDDGDLMFAAEQTLPRLKLYAAQKAKAAAERSILEAEMRSAALALETLVAQTAFELALADEMLAIETNQLAWLEGMAINAREKLKDPMSNASEPLRMESEVAQQRQKIDATQRNRARLARQLNILLGRPPEQAWPNLRLPDAATPAPALAEELRRLFQANPMLQALLNTVSAARAEIDVARRERRPIFSVGVESSIYSGGDYRQTTVAGKMTLPLFNTRLYRANLDRAQQQQVAAEREIDALERKLRGEVIAAHTEAEIAAHQADAFAKEIIPRTEKAAESTQNAWISNKASLLEVFEARRALLNARLEERRFVAAQRAALEMLRSIVPPQTKP